MKGNCPEEDIVAPETHLTTLQDEALSKPGEPLNNMVQIKPQRVNLKIRPHIPHTFEIQFRQVEDQPVDLYYLMDLSDSMRDDKDKLTALATLLGNTMKNLTKNFQLGFGSFIEKTALPYVNMIPDKIMAPCEECSPPYGFMNNLRLNENTSLFEQEIQRSKISGNLDGPEGSLDGIMQAIVCTEEIGWREKARKILLLATDASFHWAGDGKLAGIVAPNDEHCHLNSNGSYTKSTELDYPSVSQIVRQVKEHNITMLFAVTPNVVSFYEELRKLIGGAHVAELAENSENIVDLVKEQYQEISSTIELRDDAPDNVRVAYRTKCLNNGTDDIYQETNVCNGLKEGTTVGFQITVQVNHCPENKKDHKYIFNISPLGLSETVTVELDLLCECDCERPEFQSIADAKCSNVGLYECGICQCPANRYGAACQCTGNETTSESSMAACRKDSSSLVCSGRGICLCGECICYQQSESLTLGRVYGPYCECDNFSCSYHDGKICGGPKRGQCECGSCACEDGWTGEACECPSTDHSCRGSDGELCSGNGICECGVCRCAPAYSGPLCQTNLAPEGKCTEHRPCVECILASNSTECGECPSNATVETVAQLEGVREGEHQCKFKNADGCIIFYTYKTDDGFTIFRIQTEHECQEPFGVYAAMGVVFGAVVGIGLLALLVWKLIMMMHDHREYVRFEKQCLQDRQHQTVNPLYKDVVTTFSNPIYGRDPVD